MFWEMWEFEEIIRQLWMLPDLLLSILLGFAIGFERKLRFKEAGIRTHTIVCFGAALMMLISKYAFGSEADSARVAAQIVSGIGFIGAGAIMVDRKFVHGLTTAAGIWVAAGIGMATAAGLYGLAIATTVLALVGLEVFGIILFNDRRRRQDKGEQNEISDG
jgi:putative Mg2+ transporter-C (MgtC) family protein